MYDPLIILAHHLVAVLKLYQRTTKQYLVWCAGCVCVLGSSVAVFAFHCKSCSPFGPPGIFGCVVAVSTCTKGVVWRANEESSTNWKSAKSCETGKAVLWSISPFKAMAEQSFPFKPLTILPALFSQLLNPPDVLLPLQIVQIYLLTVALASYYVYQLKPEYKYFCRRREEVMRSLGPTYRVLKCAKYVCEGLS